MIDNPLIPDYKEAERFLKIISTYDSESQTDRPTFSFQTFDDSDEQRKILIETFHGEFENFKEQLHQLNKKGAGIFVTINKTDLKARKGENILWTRAYFIDSDNGSISNFSLQPNIVVSSVAGEHAYWLTKSKDDPILFKPLQKRLITYYKTDPTVCDPSRVMRLPGFYHLKNPSVPTLIKIKETSGARYNHEDIFMSVLNTEELSK